MEQKDMRFSVSIDEDTHRDVKLLSIRQHKTMATLIRQAIREFMVKHKDWVER